ncbi:hypothetical protein [Bacillus sp. CGMCC 1.16541]|uniref:hypothetical protein n=1 Tax=Bacillus sp. CGMCC 1.16541 TaxID=2185143 RepID=UPI000D72DDEC|nr:hypothetical protein [Bacillus sp. CGMCC 1.16541]
MDNRICNDSVKKVIEEKNIRSNCPMCSHKGWILADELVLQKVNGAAGDDIHFPTIMLICNQCGFVSHHSVGVLKLFSLLK